MITDTTPLRGLAGVTVGHWILDQMVMSSVSGNNSRQVVHTHVPLLLSSINWYRWNLGSIWNNYVTHWPHVWSSAASSGVWLKALNWRSAPHQRHSPMDDFTFYSEVCRGFWAPTTVFGYSYSVHTAH